MTTCATMSVKKAIRDMVSWLMAPLKRILPKPKVRPVVQPPAKTTYYMVREETFGYKALYRIAPNGRVEMWAIPRGMWVRRQDDPYKIMMLSVEINEGAVFKMAGDMVLAHRKMMQRARQPSMGMETGGTGPYL